jgi:hypothetical protein
MGHRADKLMQPSGPNTIRNLGRDIFSRSHPPVIRVYDEAGNLIETHEQAGEFDVMLTYAWDLSAGTSIGTQSHFAASLRSWNTRTLIGEPCVTNASSRA